MKYINFSLLCAFNVYGEDIDAYVAKANLEQAWGNGPWGLMKKIQDINDYKDILDKAYEFTNQANKPVFNEMAILESKKVIIHSRGYLIIRYSWKSKETLLIIDLTPTNEKFAYRRIDV